MPPRFEVDVLGGCKLETTDETTGWKVAPTTGGAYEILGGQIETSGTGYQITLALRQGTFTAVILP